MEQEKLFIESEREAIEALWLRIGGKKKFANLMFPYCSDKGRKLTPAESSRKLDNKLNGMEKKHKAKWTSEDARRAKQIGAEHECHIYKWWCDDMEGYQRSQPTEPVDTDDQLAQQIDDATKVLAKALDIYSRRQGVSEAKKAITAVQ